MGDEGDTTEARAGAARAAPPGSRRLEPARRRLAAGLALALFALGTGAAMAQPFGGRMSPDERERLRRELRQQQERGREADGAQWRRERLSPQERDQLRRQLRESRPDERRGGGRRRD